MPWRETTAMDERMQFVADARHGHDDMSTLCRRYGISRKTGGDSDSWSFRLIIGTSRSRSRK